MKEYTKEELLAIGQKTIERQQKDAERNKARMKAYQELAEKYSAEFERLYKKNLEA